MSYVIHVNVSFTDTRVFDAPMIGIKHSCAAMQWRNLSTIAVD